MSELSERQIIIPLFVSLYFIPISIPFLFPYFPVATLLSSTFVLCPLITVRPLFIHLFIYLFISHPQHFYLIFHLGLLPYLFSSPITPTGPACLPALGHGVSLPAAVLGLWHPPTSTSRALAPKWWWSQGSSCPSPAHHRGLLTSYRDR